MIADIRECMEIYQNADDAESPEEECRCEQYLTSNTVQCINTDTFVCCLHQN